MTVLQVLPEVVCTKKLLALIAFSEFVYSGQVLAAHHPVWFGMVCKFCATVSANIKFCILATLLRLLLLRKSRVGVWWYCSTRMEGSVVVAIKSRA